MTGSEVETELFLQVSEAFNESKACESPQHATWTKEHEGDAEWYVHVKHYCGHDEVRALCDKVTKVLKHPHAIATCSGCGRNVAASLVVRSITRIGSGTGE